MCGQCSRVVNCGYEWNRHSGTCRSRTPWTKARAFHDRVERPRGLGGCRRWRGRRQLSLVGFGIDSFIEVTSGSVLLWRMSVDAEVHQRERNERLALKVVGVCFLALAAYIAYESVRDLWFGRPPEHSVPGIILACVSLVVMPLLSRAKRKVGRALGSSAMQADAKQTEFCTYLSAILLVGLLLNTFFGLWWADPVAAIVMAPIIAKEGVGGFEGKTCEECHAG